MTTSPFFEPGSFASIPKELLAQPKTNISPAAKLVYLGLQSYLSGSKNQVYPGPADIHKKTGLSRRTIQKGIEKLIRSGWIRKDSKGGPDGTNLYTLYTRRMKCASAQNALPLAHKLPRTSAKSAPKEHKEEHQKRNIRRRSAKKDCFTLPSSLDTPAFREAWTRWVQYRKERKSSLTPSTAAAQLRKLSDAGPETACGMIEQSIEQGWQGLFPLKEHGRNASAKERTPNDYSKGF